MPGPFKYILIRRRPVDPIRDGGPYLEIKRRSELDCHVEVWPFAEKTNDPEKLGKIVGEGDRFIFSNEDNLTTVDHPPILSDLVSKEVTEGVSGEELASFYRGYCGARHVPI